MIETLIIIILVMFVVAALWMLHRCLQCIEMLTQRVEALEHRNLNPPRKKWVNPS